MKEPQFKAILDNYVHARFLENSYWGEVLEFPFHIMPLVVKNPDLHYKHGLSQDTRVSGNIIGLYPGPTGHRHPTHAPVVYALVEIADGKNFANTLHLRTGTRKWNGDSVSLSMPGQQHAGDVPLDEILGLPELDGLDEAALTALAIKLFYPSTNRKQLEGVLSVVTEQRERHAASLGVPVLRDTPDKYDPNYKDKWDWLRQTAEKTQNAGWNQRSTQVPQACKVCSVWEAEETTW
jgi:hypothetical protein